ncbi:MAG: ATP-binding cassette domain-containing protein [Clostridiales Family XIII bacterium]|jgi:zinc transport system ATP-binding protein|nr:ATP-binding cassette domain-containing protein [Clostridiales Family XIII bacterium]
MERLMECHELSFAYEGVTVVSALDFAINQGDYLFVMGENGAGKTTLINGLLRLIEPWTGGVFMAQGFSRSDIGYLPQQTAAQKDFPAGALEIVLSGFLPTCGLRPFYNREEKKMAASALRRLGVHDLRNRCFRELSGGQQRRVLLARALCAARRMLILDEPTAGLDPMAAEGLYALLRELNDGGMAVVMVSHDLHGAARHASHILHLGGAEPFYGSLEEFRATETGGRLFLRVAGRGREEGDAIG